MPKKTDKVAKSKQDQEGIVRANVNRNVVQSPTFASLYANDTQVQLSFWDIRLIFGVISNIPTPESGVQVTTVGEVRMSLQHAKRVAMILIQQLKQYEETIGPIPTPGD